MVHEGRCSIVIPTWNASPLVARCLVSLQQHVSPADAEIIVVDDGSTDDTIEMIESRFSEVKLISHEKNKGFGEACNTGVARASHDIVVLLNNDIVATEPFLDPLLSYFADDSVFAVNPRVYQSRSEKPGGGLVRGYMHCGLLRLRWSESDLERSAPCPTLYANGAATAMCRDKFLKLGGFDILYAPFYSEDLDLSYRAWRRGWKVRYEPGSLLTHDHGATIGTRFDADYINRVSARNRILFVWRNLRDVRYLFSHLVWMKLRVARAVIRLDFGFLRAVASAFLRWNQVRRRRRTDPPPVVSDRDILEITSSWAVAKEMPRDLTALGKI